MLEKFIYENHLGQRFSGLENGVYLNYNDLRDYSWSYESINGRISRFYRNTTTRKLPLTVVCPTDAQAVAVRNRLMDYTEADIEAKLPGKVYIGEWYTNGFITSSAKSQYLINKRYCKIELKLTSDDPSWYREQTYPFLAGSESESATGGIDYAYDYPYDYAVMLNGRRIVCDSVGSNAFKLLIYGPATDPYINIGEHRYAINGQLNAGETLLIDSITKTITLTKANGRRENWFDKRNRESYIFEPIPAEQNLVSWVGAFGFDLTVIEKRSEPKWT